MAEGKRVWGGEGKEEYGGGRGSMGRGGGVWGRGGEVECGGEEGSIGEGRGGRVRGGEESMGEGRGQFTSPMTVGLYPSVPQFPRQLSGDHTSSYS